MEAVINAVKETGGVPKIGDSPGGPPQGINKYWDITGFKDRCSWIEVDLVSFEKSVVFMKERGDRVYT